MEHITKFFNGNNFSVALNTSSYGKSQRRPDIIRNGLDWLRFDVKFSEQSIQHITLKIDAEISDVMYTFIDEQPDNAIDPLIDTNSYDFSYSTLLELLKTFIGSPVEKSHEIYKENGDDLYYIFYKRTYDFKDRKMDMATFDKMFQTLIDKFPYSLNAISTN